MYEQTEKRSIPSLLSASLNKDSNSSTNPQTREGMYYDGLKIEIHQTDIFISCIGAIRPFRQLARPIQFLTPELCSSAHPRQGKYSLRMFLCGNNKLKDFQEKQKSRSRTNFVGDSGTLTAVEYQLAFVPDLTNGETE